MQRYHDLANSVQIIFHNVNTKCFTVPKDSEFQEFIVLRESWISELFKDLQ